MKPTKCPAKEKKMRQEKWKKRGEERKQKQPWDLKLTKNWKMAKETIKSWCHFTFMTGHCK